MDTSEQYINMCRRAKELQEMWEPEPGDFYKLPGHFITCIVLKNSLIDMDAIWLPRIDQCIDMDCSQDTDFFIDCIKMEDRLEPHASAEMKGLAVVMKTIYKKYWNGEDWIKQ